MSFITDLPNKDVDDIKNDLDKYVNFSDSFIDSSIKLYKPKEGLNKIRVLPPRDWRNDFPDNEFNGYLGIKVFTHLFCTLGGDSYLCNRAFNKGDCPFCEKFDSLRQNAWNVARAFQPKARILLWLLDLEDTKYSGVKLWIAPTTIVSEILEAAYDDEAKQYLPILDPERGHIIRFKVAKEGKFNKYTGIKLLSPYPIENSLLDDVKEYKDIFIFYSYEHMKKKLEVKEEIPEEDNFINTDDMLVDTSRETVDNDSDDLLDDIPF